MGGQADGEEEEEEKGEENGDEDGSADSTGEGVLLAKNGEEVATGSATAVVVVVE